MEHIIRAAKYIAASLFTAGLLAGPVAAETQVEETLRGILGQTFSDRQVDTIKPSQIAGLYEVHISGEIWYVSKDGLHMVKGDLYETTTRVNLTDQAREAVHYKILSDYGHGELVTYPASGERKYGVTVVTDIDCVFCRKFHSHITELQEKGVEVKYLFFPRSGADTPSYHKAVSVWCADDKLEALTAAKMSQEIPERVCPNPVKDHMGVVRSLGVRSTPIIFRDDGKKIRGYYQPDPLIALLDQ